MYMSCEEFYTNYLGDCCDNDCEHCYGDNEVVFAKTDIFNELYQKMVVRKGDIFRVHCEPKVKGSNFILIDDYDYEYLDFRCERGFFNKHFSYDYVRSDE